MELTSSYLIRDARNKDFASIAELIRTCLAEFGKELDLDSDDKDLNDVEATYINANGIFLIAEYNSSIIGTVAVLQYKKGEGMLKKMYIERSHRGQGLGKLLMDEVLQRCADLQIYKLYLETLNEMTAAQALYTKYGFEVVKKIENNVRCDVLMMRELK